jgi:hypothetical protein
VLTKNGRATGVVMANGDELGPPSPRSARRRRSRTVSPTDPPPSVASRVRNVRARGVTAKINLALSAVPAFTAFGATLFR